MPEERRLIDDVHLAEAALPPTLRGISLIAVTKDSPPPDEIMKRFDPNFTQKLRHKAKQQQQPDPTRTTKFMVQELFRGFNRPNFMRSDEGPNCIYAEYNFNHLTLNGIRYLPNARITLKLFEKALPEIVKVELQYRKGMGQLQPPVNMQNPADVQAKLTDWQTFTPTSSDFEDALQQFRTAWNVTGQSRAHLTIGHILPENLLIAADRQFVYNPLAEIFRIFGYGLKTINHDGATAIFGPTGLISKSSALTPESGDQDIRNTLGLYTFKGYMPPKPLHANDKAAITLQKWYEVFKKYLDFHRAKYGQMMCHPLCRQEAERFSADVVEHSVPYKELPNADKYVDTKPFGDLKAPRENINGVKKSISPIVTPSMSNKEYLDNIYDAALQFMMLTGPIHTLEHDIGAEECSDPFYGSMGGGGVAPGTAGKTVPASDTLLDTVKFLKILEGYTEGYITKNEDRIVPEELLAFIKKSLPELRENSSVDPEQVRLGVRI